MLRAASFTSSNLISVRLLTLQGNIDRKDLDLSYSNILIEINILYGV
jgi:hypothetical protein